MSFLKSTLVALALIAALLVAMSVLLMTGGYPAHTALFALWSGSLGSWYALTSATLVRAVPLMLTGGAVAVAFRAGVFNIGAEGQLLVGAAAAATVALALPQGGIITSMLALTAGAVAGAAWAGIAALLRSRFGVLEVISTIMLNFIALHALSYLVRGPLQEPTHVYPQTSTIVQGVQLTRIPGAGRLHVGLFLALALLLACGWLFRHTAEGFRLLVAGESPSAAASAGQIDVARTTRRAFFLSGALAGCAGAVEVLGVTFALYEDISPGYGYTAIAVALLAGLDPWRIVLSATLFAALEAGEGAMQRDANVPATLVSVIEALLILAVIAVQAARWRSRSASMDASDAPVVPVVPG
ncbi:MAG: ABC-type transporter, integral rane subunit [Gemmatimonadetes bacterium]|nr:ABC-type transporter, integral rane subunit [Gemmatimonadota bacterium]